MSATPYRPKQDSAFGAPDFEVSYRDAAKKDHAVKRLVGHAYDYKLDVINEDGSVTTRTTSELVHEAGSDRPADIERLRITRKMRWSPKYISPLLRVPVERMQTQRLKSGQRLQALVSALCVSHAEMVCGQLRGMFPELEIDWVGTGEDGRSFEDNKTVLQRFCPKKGEDGRRNPNLDVLVHVGMAGEGLDATHVSEIILLRPANLTNQINQIIGRGARVIPDAPDVQAHVNFDRSTAFAAQGYTGTAIMNAMDFVPPNPDEADPDEDPREEDGWPEPLPDEPTIRIFDVELIGIDSGDAGVQRMARVLQSMGAGPSLGLDFAALYADGANEGWNTVVEMYRKMRTVEAREIDEKAVIAQWRASVKSATGALTGLVIRQMVRDGTAIEKSLPGDIKKRINERKKAACGEIVNQIDICRAHYDWLTALDREIRKSESLPSWLS
jgi:hypothetical protein